MKLVSEKTEQFFGENTPLRTAAEHGGRKYEERPQQREMAEAVAQALENNQHLCVEAPTGVGKSFAYLIPAIYQAHYTQKKVVISTHTINLQEQLINKDLKILKELIPFNFKAVLAKGRENYICLRRLDEAWQNPDEFLFTDESSQELNRLKKWSVNTTDGSRSDISPIPDVRTWMQVCCEPGNCTNQKCKFFRNCYFMKMKMDMASADIIVTNHALFFVDLAMKSQEDVDVEGILPNYAAVIFDEAHTIEECATMHLGVKVTSGGFFHTLNRLYLPGKEKDRGLLVAPKWANAQQTITRLKDRAELFFGELTEWVEMQKENPLRYTVPGHIPHFLHPELCDADAALKEVLDIEKSDSKGQEISTLKERLYDYALGMQTFLDMSEEEFVYWFETKEQSYGNALAIYGVPIKIDKILDNLLFNRDFTVIMTSATLAVNNNLRFFLNRIGAGNVSQKILTSPFDFEKQVEIYIPLEMPHPKNTAQFLPKVCEHIETFIRKTDGHAMVLFTSYAMMRKAKDELSDFFNKKGLTLLMQGEKLSNSAIIEKFQNDESSVIFGTSSFWTGVDIPGKTLSNVIIVKIPFAVPSLPLNQARIEKIEAEGGNSFRDYSLPEAILKFRQGFGRLIRSKEDHGIVVILDNRIITTNYGQQFIDSLPTCTRKTF